MPLPPGLILNPDTGQLTGTPTVPGTYVINLKVRDLLGNERIISDTVVINAYTPMTWTGAFANLMDNRAIGGNTLTRNGGLAAFTYSIFAGALPAGLSLNTGTAAITGTPTTPGAFNFTLRATDSLAQTKDILVTGTVADELILTYPFATLQGTVGVSCSQSKTVNGGTGPFTYDLSSGSMPAGLTFNSLGNMQGVPTASSSASVTARVTDVHGFTDTFVVTFDLRAFPSISGSFVRSMVGKAGYSRTFSGSNGFTPYAWIASSLPPGLSINSSSGAVTGTPTTAGTYNSTVRLTDALGNTLTFTAPVEIAPALTIGGTYLAAATVGSPYPNFNAQASGGYQPRTFSISAGALPAGLSLNTATGVISGTPTTQALYNATLRVTDADGSTAEMALEINVNGNITQSGAVPSIGTIGVAFTGDNLGSTGGAAPRSWSISFGAMPTGLALNGSTGDITGTPTVAGTYQFTVRVTEANGTWDQQGFTTVIAAQPTLSGTLIDASNGIAYSGQFARAGGHSPFTYDISAGALPTGLSINSSTGVISGTPTVNNTYNFTVRVTDNAGNVATRASTIVVYAVPVVSGTVGNQAELTDAYSSTALSVSGGKPSVAWTKSAGTLPPGMSVIGSTGDITGTPTTAGTYNFTVRATDALGRFDDSTQQIIVRAKVYISTGPATAATRNIAYADGGSVAGNGWTAYTWSVASGLIPTGLTLNTSTGTITGTPTSSGYFPFTLRVTDALGVQDTYATSINVAIPVVLSESAPNATVGVAYDTQVAVGGGWGPYSYSIVSGSLPAGMSLGTVGQNGRIYGTPTTASTYNFTVRVTDTYWPGGGSTDDIAMSIVVASYPTLSTNYDGRAMVGKAYSGTITTGGGHTPKTYAKVSGTLPPGLTLNASTGALTGTPTTAGYYSFTIRLTDALGNTKDAADAISVAAALAISNSFVTPRNEDIVYSSTVTASGGWSPRVFSLFSGSLPTGLSLTSGGTLSGTPTTPGTYNFTIRVTDDEGSIFNKAMTVVIEDVTAALVITASPNPSSDTVFTSGYLVTAIASSTVSYTGGSGSGYTGSWSFVSASGSAGAFAVGGANSNTLTVQRSGQFEYDRTEIWRFTGHDSLGNVDTVDVPFTLVIFNNS